VSTLTADPQATTVRLATPELPESIGKYRVLRKLGEGATSDVFLARDEFHQREVAIKRARPNRPAPPPTATSPRASSPPRRRWSAG